MEPWDGPASIAFTDGRQIGAVLDRNGLRPSRYLVTKGGLVVMASETGVLDIPPEQVQFKGRLQPGRMFLVDTVEGRIVDDEEIKESIAARKPYGQWLKEKLVDLDNLPEPPDAPSLDGHPADELLLHQRAFGYTIEDLKILMAPMAVNAQEAVGSMGTDTPLAVLSNQAPLLFNYFKQLFAQVTNPPIDPIREELVMSLETTIGGEQNLFEETPLHCRQLRLKQPILTNAELAKIKRLAQPGLKSITLPMLYRVAEGEAGLRGALDELCGRASQAIADGYTIIVISDRGMDAEHAAIPSLLATGAVHHHLIREGTRTQAGLVVESGEPREVMHFCLLIGYGAGAINPYLAFSTLGGMIREGILKDIDEAAAIEHYIKAISKSLLKVSSKMGISTLQSYRGAQIFEAIGLNHEVIDRYFTWTASRIEGIGSRRDRGRDRTPPRPCLQLRSGARRRTRPRRAVPMAPPRRVPHVQPRTRSPSFSTPCARAATACSRNTPGVVDENSRHLATLRGLFKFKTADAPIPIEEVEPASEIVKRFKTGAMSFGSISKEAHENSRHRDEPDRRQEQHRRRRRRPRALRSRPQRRLAPQRHQAGGFGTLRRDQRISRQRRRAADQDGAGREAGRRRPTARPQGRRRSSPRSATRRRESA